MIEQQSWGRLGPLPHHAVALDGLAAQPVLTVAQPPALAYGMGRSYGDVCLNPGGTLWLTSAMDHWLAFDEEQGLLTCQAGALLGDIQRLLAPRGWMLPVTPGTQFVTVGGAIANDVHGKNHHHAGTFGDHVTVLTLLRTDGQRIDCSPTQQADWFRATVGGMGLTGLIHQATLQLQRVAGPWLESETTAFAQLDQFYDLAAAAEADWAYTVAWLDCLSPQGRGIFLRANHAADGVSAGRAPARHSRNMPVTPPVSLVNGLSLRAFNSVYYHIHRRRQGPSVSHYQPFFYPLDGIAHWNRMYGPRGFYQYQCVVPFGAGPTAIAAMLEAIARSGQGSFLAVLKTFGDRPAAGLLSFVQPGITLALDFPNRGAKTLQLFDRLDRIVADAGGRLYPAKDARMPADLFQASYPNLPEFLQYRDAGISSAMSRRLMGY